MGNAGKDVTETVTYTPINDQNNNKIPDEEETYTLTINYKYSNGKEALKTYTKQLLDGTNYSIYNTLIVSPPGCG